MVGVVGVAVGATLTALATGLGVLPFLRRRPIGEMARARANALAAGVMVGASIGLIAEGAGWGVIRVVLGAVLGALFVIVVQRILGDGHSLEFGSVTGTSAAKVFLIMVVMTAHSIAEGVGVGVAYGGGEALGVTTTVAIALHNIPEGLAIALVMIPRGATVAAAAVWSIVSSLPQPLLAVPAFLLVDSFSSALPLGLGFAAGAMIWMAASELLPDAVAGVGAGNAWMVALAAAGATVGAQLLLGA